MVSRTTALELPESLYVRLQQTAQATRQSLDAVLMRALQVGSPRSWETAPAEFQADLAVLDRLDDATLWHIARTRATPTQMDRYQTLLDKNANQTLSASERNELTQLRITLDRDILQWRGHQIPSAGKL